MAGAGLVLEPVEVAGPGRWRWLLRTESGQALAAHEVSLPVPGTSFEGDGFADLYRFLRREAVPDRRVQSEAELVERVGAWAGQQLLGPEVMRALLAEAPVTVRVPVPAELAFLPDRPWEIASVDGMTLGREQVGFVFDLPDTRPRPHGDGSGGQLGPVRVLAVFSLPAGGTALALRRERYALQQLVKKVGQGQTPRQVQLRVLQYGATRAALVDAIDDEDGWDVLHVSGHGRTGVLVLEKEDGTPDPITPQNLVELLYPMRRRLRLVVLSACESAAATTAQTLHLLNLPEQAAVLDQEAVTEATQPTTLVGTAAGPGTAVPAGDGSLAAAAGLGRSVVTRLGCAVVAMRYPVVDEFAIDLTGRFYRGVLERGQPVDVALARALPSAAPVPASIGAPAVSLATPALLGPAAGLRLYPPVGTAAPVSTAMANFPAEPSRFVGRTTTLTRARHALLPPTAGAAAGLPDPAVTGVLLHGMAGAGKTTAAVELAYQTRTSFTALAYWTAPPRGQWQTALHRLAESLETQLNPVLNPDNAPHAETVRLVGATTSSEKLQAALPRLTELLEQSRLLLVLDNLETLLSDSGEWLDPMFGALVSALLHHSGASRVLLTSRTVPALLTADRVWVVPIHALPRDEALLLARELPHLRALGHDSEPPTRAGDTSPAATRVAGDRMLLARTLSVVQGHPKLLELADAAAADPSRPDEPAAVNTAVLEARVAAAEQAATARGVTLDAFLTSGDTNADPDQLAAALADWTRTTSTALADNSRLLLRLLAAVEPADRNSLVLDVNWDPLWSRLERPSEPPPWSDALGPIAAAALIDLRVIDTQDDRMVLVQVELHPGITDTVRADTAHETLTAVDTQLAAFWEGMCRQARHQEQHEQAGKLVVHAALAAAPYLLRLQKWDTAGELLEQATLRDRSPDTAAAVLPHLHAIATATAGTDTELAARGLLARTLRLSDSAQAETELRTVLDLADHRNDYRVARTAVSDLVNLLVVRSRYAAALDLTDRMADLTRRGGYGPWTQLSDTRQRLELLAMTGDPAPVLAEVQRLRDLMSTLPEVDDRPEIVVPWDVRETLLDTGRSTALQLGQWQDALDLNAEILRSQRRRGATEYDLATTAFNDHGPLLRLGQLAEADQLLQNCQHTFQDTGETQGLGLVFSARAYLAALQEYPASAVGHMLTALRYQYTTGLAATIADSHYNLAGHLRNAHEPTEIWLAHLLAATLVDHLAGRDRQAALKLGALAEQLSNPDTDRAAPATITELITRIDQTEGVDLAALLIALQPDPAQHQAALEHILHTARTMPPDQTPTPDQLAAQWDALLAGIIATTGGDQAAADAVDRALAELSGTTDWAALTAVLRRILAGERDADMLLPGLDPIDTTITTRLLDALAAPPVAPTHTEDEPPTG